MNGAGARAFDVPDADDFVARGRRRRPGLAPRVGRLPDVPRPVRDRRALGGRAARVGRAARLGRAPRPDAARDTPLEWFGGDLAGSSSTSTTSRRSARTSLYLTPIFPAGSTHRYDARRFDHVDPLLGGDEALGVAGRTRRTRAACASSATSRSTTAATATSGSCAAPRGRAAPEREFFLFDERVPHGYESWSAFRRCRSSTTARHELRRRVSPTGRHVVRRWLRAPFGLDGWRIDVANMTGRYRDVDVALDVSPRRARRGAGGASRRRPRRRARARLPRRPARRRLARHDELHGLPASGLGVAARRRAARRAADGFLGPAGRRAGDPGGADASATMRRFRAGVPWQAVVHSWTLLDSHDTARFGDGGG